MIDLSLSFSLEWKFELYKNLPFSLIRSSILQKVDIFLLRHGNAPIKGALGLFAYSTSGHVAGLRMVRLYTREELMAKFGWEEYVIFSLMLAVSTGIGVFFWCQGRIRAKRADPDQAQGNAEFLLGGKSVGTFPVTLSLIARYYVEYEFKQTIPA